MLYGKRPFGDGQSQERVLTNNVMLNAREVQFPTNSTTNNTTTNTTTGSSSSMASNTPKKSASTTVVPNVSNEAKNFIRLCLTYEQSLRPNIAQLCNHDYVKGSR